MVYEVRHISRLLLGGTLPKRQRKTGEDSAREFQERYGTNLDKYRKLQGASFAWVTTPFGGAPKSKEGEPPSSTDEVFPSYCQGEDAPMHRLRAACDAPGHKVPTPPILPGQRNFQGPSGIMGHGTEGSDLFEPGSLNLGYKCQWAPIFRSKLDPCASGRSHSVSRFRPLAVKPLISVEKRNSRELRDHTAV
ncbi:hypothetical protein K0M31_014006 [Melipona bicolor]|uniref:Uncharacterized protein n=1 Tax=Melipona bicolor TaxID=60889 RepID=A0AA40G8W3_9HYME|nr:hypothetical protein K0M31_014006 [Melipona bicolor]